MEREQLRSSWREHYTVREIINSSDFVTYFPYDSTEMEVGRKPIHVLTECYEIWQRRKIPKGHRSRAEAAEVEVQVNWSDSGSDDETEQKSKKKRIVLTLTPLVVTFYLGFLSPF